MTNEVKNKENLVKIYTDGACRGNPGPGGWGAILLYNGVQKEINGFMPETTNNQMELTAVIESLKIIKRSLPIEIYTDSTYVKNGITEWIFNWKQNNWRNSAKKPVKNVDLWKKLDEQVSAHSISWHWVKGHSGNKYNDIADFLATSAIDNSL